MKYVLYHKNCTDGFGAAYAFWKKYPEYKYIAVGYGEDVPPLPEAEHVFIVDFSYPRETLLKMREQFLLTVLDHHKTAQEDLQGLEFAHFNMDKSGARLAWEFVHGNVEPPKIILYIEDRDLWKKVLPNSEEISAFMFQFERTFDTFKLIELSLEKQFEECVLCGLSILNYMKILINQLCSKAIKGKLNGIEVLFVNTPILQSEVGNKLITDGKGEIVACYADDSKGGIYVSLRSRKDIDCSGISKAFGGGGHKNASGFHVPNSPSISFLNGHSKAQSRNGNHHIQSNN
jgi:oligoribonuclease NrnB/cAMP/cGMP phosphodiesterase (DHH superfamily)